MVDLEAERERVRKDLTGLEKRIESSRAKLSNSGFTQKAPPDIVERERAKLVDLELQLDRLHERLNTLK
jgi:valyl-tRNA synthetase